MFKDIESRYDGSFILNTKIGVLYKGWTGTHPRISPQVYYIIPHVAAGHWNEERNRSTSLPSKKQIALYKLKTGVSARTARYMSLLTEQLLNCENDRNKQAAILASTLTFYPN